MINVLEEIKPFLTFKSNDDFYYLQVLKRKKENPELGSNSYLVKSYMITSIEYLEMKMHEIIAFCNYHNARACINLNVRSFRRCSLKMLKKVTDQILNEDFTHTKKAYDSVCGAEKPKDNKKWIIDIDVKDLDFVEEVKEYVNNLTPNPGENKIFKVLETKNGFHIITSPFRVDMFVNDFPGIDIQRNNPVNLYIP